MTGRSSSWVHTPVVVSAPQNVSFIRIGIPLLLVTLLASCAALGTSGDPSPEPLPGNLESALGAWHDANGSTLPQGQPFVMDVFRGPIHCGWQNVVFLVLAWPLGKPVPGPFMGSPRTLMFARAPSLGGLPPSSFTATFSAQARLPEGTHDTGFAREGWHLWVKDSRIDKAVWLVNGGTIERWPAAKQIIGCM